MLNVAKVGGSTTVVLGECISSIDKQKSAYRPISDNRQIRSTRAIRTFLLID